jgi:lysophospholipase L1-like esterase
MLALLAAIALTQKAPFYDEVMAFAKADQVHKPALHQILFIGSSSFTRWENVNQDLPGFGILNRAFGGSSLPDVIRYVDLVVTPYEPRQIVLYCGENDFAGDPSLAPETVTSRFKTLYTLIRQRESQVPFVYVSMKPSPSRWNLYPKMQASNAQIKSFLETQPNSQYVEIGDTMLDNSGQPKPEIFVSDNLHMNEKGYQLWADRLRTVLLPKPSQLSVTLDPVQRPVAASSR